MAQQKGQVLLEKNKTSRASPKGNPHSVSNVDAAQGPRNRQYRQRNQAC
jgi:hypothetical protein